MRGAHLRSRVTIADLVPGLRELCSTFRLVDLALEHVDDRKLMDALMTGTKMVDRRLIDAIDALPLLADPNVSRALGA